MPTTTEEESKFHEAEDDALHAIATQMCQGDCYMFYQGEVASVMALARRLRRQSKRNPGRRQGAGYHPRPLSKAAKIVARLLKRRLASSGNSK
jgi:hypothetical protein